MADTSTTLNAGTGGDVLDETSVTQADGSTAVKRPRVDLGFAADDSRGRLVDKTTPLPVGNDRLELIVGQMAADVRELKELLLQFFHS